jgi:transcriptional regulator with XRE-family HTH domain
MTPTRRHGQLTQMAKAHDLIAGDDDPAAARRRLVGRRLRALRVAQDASLREVATAVDVSPSFLSMIERGQNDLSLGRFSRLAMFFGVPPSELLADDEVKPGPDIADLRELEPVDRGEGVDYRIVRRDPPQVVAVTLAPGARFTDLRAHRGEDTWLITNGRAQVLYGADVYDLDTFQVATFSGLVPHGISNPYPEPAVLLAVCSVPYW